jgi:hypothetical protein
MRRLLCHLGLHRWDRRFLFGRPHIEARECLWCRACQRKLGNVWLAATKDWGWL